MDNEQNNKQNTRKPGAEVGARSSRPPESPGAAAEEQKWSAIYNNNAAQGVRRARSGGRRAARQASGAEEPQQQGQRPAYNKEYAQGLRGKKRRANRLAKRLSRKQGVSGQKEKERLSGFGFKMILGVAIVKDVFDVLAGFVALIILSFGSSLVVGTIISGYFGSWVAGVATGVALQLLKFTGIGTAVIGSLNMGLLFTFSLLAMFISLFLHFTIITYLTFQGIFGLQRGIARKLAVISVSLIISIIPFINWLPETTATLLILRRFDKEGAKKEKRKMRALRTSSLPVKQFA